MKLSAPRNVTWLIAVIAGALGTLQHYGVIHVAAIRPYDFLLVAAALGLLLVATLLKGL